MANGAVALTPIPDSVRFRDAAIGNLVPDDVAEALMHTMPGNDGRVWAGNQEKEPSATHLSVHKTISKVRRKQREGQAVRLTRNDRVQA